MRALGIIVTFLLAGHGGQTPSASEAGHAFPAYERSVALVRRALGDGKGHPRLRHVLARVHFRAGRFRKAVSEFRAVLEVDPGFGESHLGLGAAYRKLEMPEEAAEAFRTAVETGPEGVAVRARISLAKLLHREGRDTAAIEHLRALVEEGHSQADLYYQLGLTLRSEARRCAREGERAKAEALEKEARDVLTRAVSLDPTHAQAHYVLGRLLLQAGKSERGRREMALFQRHRETQSGVDEDGLSTSADEFEATTWLELARALLETGEQGRALHSLDRALEVRDGFEPALALRGWIYKRSGQEEKALRSYGVLLERNPEHAEALWNLGTIHLERGERKKAGEYLLRAAESRGHFPAGWEILYKLASREVVHADRVEEFARKALRDRKSPENFVNYAMVLYEAGELDGCEEVLRRGLRFHPGHAQIEKGLAAVRKAMGGR